MTSAQYSPDGQEVLLTRQDGTAQLCCSTSGVCLRTFEGHEGAIVAAGFAPDC